MGRTQAVGGAVRCGVWGGELQAAATPGSARRAGRDAAPAGPSAALRLLPQRCASPTAAGRAWAGSGRREQALPGCYEFWPKQYTYFVFLCFHESSSSVE